MAFPKHQNPLDWITQCWNIALGEQAHPVKDDWLIGPIGDIGGIADSFVSRIADENGLAVGRNLPFSGLSDSLAVFEKAKNRVNPQIENFYQETINFSLEVWTQWQPVFASLGHLVHRLFSQRIQQLNLPQYPLDTSLGLESEIISLLDQNRQTRYRVWYRRLKTNGEVVYSGIYTHCTTPNGETCLKVIFPLPQGSATVIMSVDCDEKGNLILESKGRRCGDPGFYFLVKDRKGNLWKHYLPSFHERIFVYEDDEGTLRANHTMDLWKLRAYELHYKMTAN